ncbi:putative DNA/RNA-binding protein Alba [Medicago truncatula]|uniref:Putative DNA/RNA-binding protein Alba n=1 Tax=Medicago truncatula TaxID=3880 RepID=A0A396IYW8_MEDTR|nr:putative DNA/RNA-binding protein Alba [Medicago truncatula]
MMSFLSLVATEKEADDIILKAMGRAINKTVISMQKIEKDCLFIRTLILDQLI